MAGGRQNAAMLMTADKAFPSSGRTRWGGYRTAPGPLASCRECMAWPIQHVQDQHVHAQAHVSQLLPVDHLTRVPIDHLTA